LILLIFAPEGNAGDSVPGARFFASPDFSSRSPSDQRWCRKVVASTGQAIAPALSSAESIVIYSLDPTHLEDFRPGVTDRTHFHCYPILGRAMWRPGDFDTLRRTLIEGLTPCERVLCFAPRHGLRIHTARATIDLVLCFECHKMQVFGASPDRRTDDCFFDGEVLQMLNAFLDAHRIPRSIPPSPDEPR
jgi:hypothetical protein